MLIKRVHIKLNTESEIQLRWLILWPHKNDYWGAEVRSCSVNDKVKPLSPELTQGWFHRSIAPWTVWEAYYLLHSMLNMPTQNTVLDFSITLLQGMTYALQKHGRKPKSYHDSHFSYVNQVNIWPLDCVQHSADIYIYIYIYTVQVYPHCYLHMPPCSLILQESFGCSNSHSTAGRCKK